MNSLISSIDQSPSRFKPDNYCLPSLSKKTSLKFESDPTIAKNHEANIKAMLEAKEARTKYAKLEHLKLKRKIKQQTKDSNKFSIERGAQVDDSGSRGSSSSRSVRNQFIEKQLI